MQDFIENYPYTTPRLALAPPFAEYVEDVVLPADTVQRVTIPAGANFVLASFDGDVRMRLGTGTTSLTLPAASSMNGSGAELNPGARRIPAKLSDGTTVPTHLVLRAPLACKGSLAFYR